MDCRKEWIIIMIDGEKTMKKKGTPVYEEIYDIAWPRVPLKAKVIYMDIDHEFFYAKWYKSLSKNKLHFLGFVPKYVVERVIKENNYVAKSN